MSIYEAGDLIRIKTPTEPSFGTTLEEGSEGIIVSAHPGRVEAAFEGIGLVSVSLNVIKKKVRRVERLVKAKNLKLSDEIHLPGSGEYVKIASISRDDYETREPSISVESVAYNHHQYGYNELVEVRR